MCQHGGMDNSIAEAQFAGARTIFAGNVDAPGSAVARPGGPSRPMNRTLDDEAPNRTHAVAQGLSLP